MVTFERRLYPSEQSQQRDDRGDIRSARRVENGEAGIITGVDPEQGEGGRVTVQLRDREVTLQRDQLDALRLGYAQHVYSAQGRTVDNAFVLLGGWQTDRENSYVGISRARESTVVVTDFSSLNVEKGNRDAALRELGERFAQSRTKVAATALVDRQRDSPELVVLQREIADLKRLRDMQRGPALKGPQRYRDGEKLEPVDAIAKITTDLEKIRKRSADRADDDSRQLRRPGLDRSYDHDHHEQQRQHEREGFDHEM